MPRWLVFTVLVLIVRLTHEKNDDLEKKRLSHESLDVEPQKLKTIVELADLPHLKEALRNILVPRVVGTPGHEAVRNYLMKSMKDLGWTVTTDRFEETAPILGRLTFENVIAKLNPNAERYLMLSCHYDSKFYTDHEFLGATDSAVPCAMLVNLAHTLQTYLNKHKANNELSLMFVFFDGEEAFENWSPTDAIYGSRHLAERWHNEDFLKRIDIMVLLDLIGAADPEFYSFFKNTQNWYLILVSAEERLSELGHLAKYQTSSVAKRPTSRAYFQAKSANSGIEDDHIPFLRLKVPILHVIPVPFPDVWHTPADNGNNIDYDTTENLNHIFRVFVVEYLNIAV